MTTFQPSARVLARNGESFAEVSPVMDVNQGSQALAEVMQTREATEQISVGDVPSLLEPAGVPSDSGPVQSYSGTAHAGPSVPHTSAPQVQAPPRKGKTFKTKDGRRMTGRKVLNSKVLIKVLAVLNKYDNSKWFKVSASSESVCE